MEAQEGLASAVDALWAVLAVKGKTGKFVTVLKVFRGRPAAEADARHRNDTAACVRSPHRYVVSSVLGEVVESKEETPTSLLGQFAEVRQVTDYPLGLGYGDLISIPMRGLPNPLPRGSAVFVAVAKEE